MRQNRYIYEAFWTAGAAVAKKTKRMRIKKKKEVSILALSSDRYACSRPESTHHNDGILFAAPFTGLTLSGLHYRSRDIGAFADLPIPHRYLVGGHSTQDIASLLQ